MVTDKIKTEISTNFINKLFILADLIPPNDEITPEDLDNALSKIEEKFNNILHYDFSSSSNLPNTKEKAADDSGRAKKVLIVDDMGIIMHVLIHLVYMAKVFNMTS